MDSSVENKSCGSRIIVKAAIAFQKIMIEGTVKTKATDFKIRAGMLESYNGEEVDVTIPSNVIIIGPEAFKNCIGLKSVTIPESVAKIGRCAFYRCENLTSIADMRISYNKLLTWDRTDANRKNGCALSLYILSKAVIIML